MRPHQYFDQLIDLLNSAVCTNLSGEIFPLETAVETCLALIEETRGQKGRIIVIGNGGSAAIASHTAIDYMKNGGFQTICFNEASLLTCYGNDYGYDKVFSKPIEMVALPEDLLIAISSSGQSQNILNAVAAANEKGCRVLTLSGFNTSNPLRQLGTMNLYVPSGAYGFVELSHQIFLHMLLDMIMAGAHDT